LDKIVILFDGGLKDHKIKLPPLTRLFKQQKLGEQVRLKVEEVVPNWVAFEAVCGFEQLIERDLGVETGRGGARGPDEHQLLTGLDYQKFRDRLLKVFICGLSFNQFLELLDISR
jgi:hypothetical protein